VGKGGLVRGVAKNFGGRWVYCAVSSERKVWGCVGQGDGGGEESAIGGEFQWARRSMKHGEEGI